jgi:flagellar L-ring protein precursor FlgH
MIHGRPLSALGMILIVASPGCALIRRAGPPSLADDVAKLDRAVSELPAAPAPASPSGSLWSDAGPGAALVRDTRAFRVNDLLTIRVNEASNGESEASTGLSRKANVKLGAKTALGLENPNAQPGRFNLADVLDASTDSKHDGQGKTSRSNTLSASLTARVRRVLPNGDLVIAGQKIVVVNRDRQLLTLVGSVRPVDVRADNTVSSSLVGDLTVRLWGRGEVDDTVREGWFVRLMHRLWPF